jgi:rhodanese-related sulfurtransferase
MSDYCFRCGDTAYVPDGAIEPYVYWIDPPALAADLPYVLILDTRSQIQAAATPLPGNVLGIPLDNLLAQRQQVPHDVPVIIVGDSVDAATRANHMLRHHGFDNLFVLTGGVANWSHWMTTSLGKDWKRTMGASMQGVFGNYTCTLPFFPSVWGGIVGWAVARTYAGKGGTVHIAGKNRTPGNVGLGVFVGGMAYNVLAGMTCKPTG